MRPTARWRAAEPVATRRGVVSQQRIVVSRRWRARDRAASTYLEPRDLGAVRCLVARVVGGALVHNNLRPLGALAAPATDGGTPGARPAVVRRSGRGFSVGRRAGDSIGADVLNSAIVTHQGRPEASKKRKIRAGLDTIETIIALASVGKHLLAASSSVSVLTFFW